LHLIRQRARIELAQGATCPAWVYWNTSASGYFRTQWDALQLKALDLAKLTAAERLMLVYDLTAQKEQVGAAAMLAKLAHDSELEVAKAAGLAAK
jgi:hypothetical protein